MKKALSMFICILVMGGAVTVHAGSTGLSAGLALDFPHYEGLYLEPSFGIHTGLFSGVNLDLGAGLGIRMVEGIPWFVLPVRAGVDFLFAEGESLVPALGVGLAPTIAWHEGEGSFSMGPYIKGSLKARIHPLMSWYVMAEQALLIGPPRWLSTGTRLETGVDFMLSGN